MRLKIRHAITCTFPEPTRNVTRILRLTPRSFEGQHVIGWQIDVDVDCILKAGEDGFGNLTHGFTAKGPCEALTITVAGEVDNFDAAGVVRGSAERMPIDIYLRETPLTVADDTLRRFAQDIAAGATSRLGIAHALMRGLHDTVAFAADVPDAETGAAAFLAKRGNGTDMAHIYAACARHMGIPARVVSGYYLCDDHERGIAHAWAEVFVDGLGWTGFDAAHDLCPQDTHVRLATGLDMLGATMMRGSGFDTVVHVLDMSAPYGRSWGQTQSQGNGRQSQNQAGQSQSQGGQAQSQGGGGQSQRQG